MTKPGPRRPVPPAARESYLGLHRGLEPRGATAVKLSAPRWLAAYGRLTAFEALRDEPDGTHLFRHEFEGAARPVWAYDETGQLHVVGGRYTVTEAGVEDTSPRDPPRNTARGMRHTYEVPMVNPSHGLSRKDKESAMDVGVIGGTAAAYVAGADWLLDQTSMGEGMKTVVAALAGVGAGTVMIHTNTAPKVGTGLAVGGIVAGIVGLVNYVRAQAYLRSLSAPGQTAQVTAPQPSSGAGQIPPPAVGRHLPSGVPSGYSLITADRCSANGGADR